MKMSITAIFDLLIIFIIIDIRNVISPSICSK